MRIYFGNEESGVSYEKEYEKDMEEALALIAGKEGLDEDICEVSVSFVGKERIRELNRDFRDTDKVTDVLSFPQFESVEEIREMGSMTGAAELGDVVICMDRAGEQAEEYGHSLKREVIYLFVHSILHLLGYDHMEDEEKRVMRAREEEIMTELGIER